MTSGFSVRFWGVRGSIPCPGAETLRYGGNTPCVEVRCGDALLIFDGGSGIRPLGNALLASGGKIDADIYLTHCHFDHVGGLPFFGPFYDAQSVLRMWVGNLKPRHKLEDILGQLMSDPLFPIGVDAFAAQLAFHDFEAGETLNPHPGIVIKTGKLNHPDGATGYRVEYGGRVFAYLTDNELRGGAFEPHIVDLARGADLLVYDCTFTQAEIASKKGWGHSTWEEGIKLAQAADAKRFCLFHHNPDHDDATMDRIGAEAAKARPGTIVSAEGMTITL